MPQGTGAGNPLADLLFAVAFCKVVAMLRRKLQEAGLITSFVSTGARAFLGIGPEATGDDVVKLKDSSYADDLAFAIWCLPHLVFAYLQTAVNIAWAVYESCGFRVNFGPTKRRLRCHGEAQTQNSFGWKWNSYMVTRSP